MERLIIVVDCPDEWRERLDPIRVATTILDQLGQTGGDSEIGVRARWATSYIEPLEDAPVGALPGKAEQ